MKILLFTLIASALFAADAPKPDARDEQIKVLKAQAEVSASVIASKDAAIAAKDALVKVFQSADYQAFQVAGAKAADAEAKVQAARIAADKQDTESCKAAPTLDVCPKTTK